MELYNGIKSLETAAQKEVSASMKTLGMNINDLALNKNPNIDAVAREEARLWIAGQEYINGYKRLKALSMFPNLTKNDIDKFTGTYKFFLEHKDAEKAGEMGVLNKLLSAYVNGVALSSQQNNTEVRGNYSC